MQQLRDIAPARVPVYPSFPEAVVYTVLAFIASLLISAFVVIAADTAFDSVKTTVDLQRVVGSASLGGIDRSLAGAVAKRQVSSKKLQRRLRNSGKQIDRSLTLAGVPGGGLIEVGGFASSDDARPTAEAVAWALASAGRNVRCVSPPLLRESVDLDLPDALEVVTAAESGAVLTIAARGSGAKGMELASDGPSDNLLVLVEAGGASDSELESTVRQGEQLNGRSPLYLMLLS